MSDQALGPESQFFFSGEVCRISHGSAAKMRARGFDPDAVADMVEKGNYKVESDRNYELRIALFGVLASGRRVIVPFDYDDDDKIELVTAFGPDDPECASFKSERDQRHDRWRRRKSKGEAKPEDGQQGP